MKRMMIAFAAVAAFSLQASAQDPVEYTCEIKDFDAKVTQASTIVKFELRSNLPDSAVVVINARIVRHRLQIQQEDKLTSNQVDMIVSTTKSQISGGKSSSLVRIDLATPGIYQFDFAFDPEKQMSTDVLKRKMGKKNYYRRDFPAFKVIVGEPQRLLQQLFTDSAECASHLDKSRKLFARIEKESQGADWAEKTLKVLEDINKEKEKCSAEMGGSLMNATYEFIVAILDDLDRTRTYIEQLLKDREASKKKSAAGGGGGAGGGGESGGGDDTHKDAGPADTALSSSADGGRLKLEKLDKFIDRADVVRIRETLSWSGQFIRMSMGKLDDAYARVRAGEKPEIFLKAKNFADDCTGEIKRGYTTLKAGSGSGDVLKLRQQTFESWQTIETGMVMDDKQKGLAPTFDRYGAALEKHAGEGAPEFGAEMKKQAAELAAFLSSIEKKMVGGKEPGQ
jgi:hypothetical protein